MIQNSLRDLLYVIFRHKLKILVIFFGTFTLFAAYTFIAEEVYRSEAKLLIRLGRESLSVDPSVSGPTIYASRDRETEVNSELAILRSRSISEQVVNELTPEAFLAKPDELVDVIPPDESMKEAQQDLRAIRREVREQEKKGKSLLVALDLVTELTPQEQAVKYVTENLDVRVEAKTDIITVTFDSPSRTLAKDALARILDSYQAQHILAYSAQASPRFFEEKTEEYKLLLEATQQELAEFRTANGISNIERQKEVLLNQLSELKLSSSENAAQTTAARKRCASLEGTLDGRSKTHEISRTTGMTNFAADALKEKLLELKLQEKDLAARYQESHRPLQDVRLMIQETELLLKTENETHTEVTSGVDTTYQQVQFALENERAQLGGFEARQAVIDESLAHQGEALAQLTNHEMALRNLEQAVKLAEADYERYHENLQRARISNALDLDKVSNVSIVQPATMPMGPIKPNKMLNLVLSVLIAAFAATTFAFVFEYLDDSMHTPEHIEKWVGVPVLAAVSNREYKAYA